MRDRGATPSCPGHATGKGGRRNGIAARYVSGYLWAAHEDGGDDSLAVETHAWLEALLAGENGRGEPVRVGADPTNRRPSGERHVKIGHGRHYADVPPVRGVYQGTATSQLDASVQMTLSIRRPAPAPERVAPEGGRARRAGP